MSFLERKKKREEKEQWCCIPDVRPLKRPLVSSVAMALNNIDFWRGARLILLLTLISLLSTQQKRGFLQAAFLITYANICYDCRLKILNVITCKAKTIYDIINNTGRSNVDCIDRMTCLWIRSIHISWLCICQQAGIDVTHTLFVGGHFLHWDIERRCSEFAFRGQCKATMSCQICRQYHTNIWYVNSSEDGTQKTLKPTVFNGFHQWGRPFNSSHQREEQTSYIRLFGLEVLKKSVFWQIWNRLRSKALFQGVSWFICLRHKRDL